MKKQRILAAFLALLMMLGMLAGCSGENPAPTGGGESPGSPASAGPDKPEKIIFATFPGQEATYQAIAEAYKTETGIEVEVNILPRNGYREALIGPLSSGSSEFDVVYLQNSWVAEFAEAEFIEPLDSLLQADELSAIESDNFPYVYQAGTYDGKLWGLPWDLSTFFLFYRTDLIENPPETMEEYLELAKRFTKSLNPDSPTNYGAVLQGSPERVNYQEWYSYLWSFGGELFDENGIPTLNSPEAVAALEFEYGFKNTHGVVPPDVDNYAYSEVLSAFQEGVSAMVVQWNASFATFANSEASPKVYDKFAAASFPAYENEAGEKTSAPFAKAWYLSVNKASKNKAAAADFIKFFTSYEGSMISLRNGSSPGSVSAWEDPETAELRADAGLFKDTLSRARMTPNIPEMSAIESELAQALTHVLAGQRTAAEALDRANEAAVKILKQSGRIS